MSPTWSIDTVSDVDVARAVFPNVRPNSGATVEVLYVLLVAGRFCGGASEPRMPRLNSARFMGMPAGGVRYAAREGMNDDCVCALALAVMHWSRKRALASYSSMEWVK